MIEAPSVTKATISESPIPNSSSLSLTSCRMVSDFFEAQTRTIPKFTKSWLDHRCVHVYCQVSPILTSPFIKGSNKPFTTLLTLLQLFLCSHLCGYKELINLVPDCCWGRMRNHLLISHVMADFTYSDLAIWLKERRSSAANWAYISCWLFWVVYETSSRCFFCFFAAGADELVSVFFSGRMLWEAWRWSTTAIWSMMLQWSSCNS